MSTIGKKGAVIVQEVGRLASRGRNEETGGEDKGKSKKSSQIPSLNISLNMNQNMINSFFVHNEEVYKTCHEVACSDPPTLNPKSVPEASRSA
jgi:hypothetical protein